MSISAVVGAQWGDEGKGKIVDLLSKNVEVVARFQGGANAGHTVYHNENKLILHQIPSGILRDQCVCVLGSGMVIDPIDLINEISELKSYGFTLSGKLYISQHAHIVTPIHKFLDMFKEKSSKNPIGTTCKGIGPAYKDKYSRVGIRAIDLLDDNIVKTKIDKRLDKISNRYNINESDITQIKKDLKIFFDAIEEIKEYISDSFEILHSHIEKGASILIEGAQGALLDIDHGTYPYVTSSNPSIGGIANGLGIPLTLLNNAIGIYKAYTTRVGEGPFPTEINDDTGEMLREVGKEYGATTGRPRRCGWFDAVAARYTAQLNGLHSLVITKLDILSGLEKIKVCTRYKYRDSETKLMSNVINNLGDVEPIYNEFQGWEEDISNITSYSSLPAAAKDYLDFIASELNVPIKIISVGPQRDQVIQI